MDAELQSGGARVCTQAVQSQLQRDPNQHMAAVALLTGTWAAIFLQGHRSQREPETGL